MQVYNEEKKDAGDGDDASKTVNGNDDSGHIMR